MTRLERFGAGLSLGCAIHCAATPVLVGAMPLMGAQLSHAHWVEALVIGLVAVIGYSTLGMSFRRHRRWSPLLLFSLGFGLLLLGQTEWLHELHTAVAVPGSLALVGAQLLNRRCPVCRCGGHH